jgi:hypothetical protein
MFYPYQSCESGRQRDGEKPHETRNAPAPDINFGLSTSRHCIKSDTCFVSIRSPGPKLTTRHRMSNALFENVVSRHTSITQTEAVMVHIKLGKMQSSTIIKQTRINVHVVDGLPGNHYETLRYPSCPEI